MSGDRQLIDRIKGHFTRKSSAHLRRIVAAGDPDHWSTEAATAAREVLHDRAAGRAVEPADADDEEPALPTEQEVNRLAWIAGLNLLALPLGFIVLPGIATDEDDPIARDQPVPFGPGVAWLALCTADTAGVAAALGLRGSREATWAEGIDAAHRSAVFVTPPVGEWTLAVSTALFPPRDVGAFVRTLLEPLSLEYGDAQYFCTHSEAGLHAWGRAVGGRVLRGYAWLGREEVTLWNEGPPTRAEQTTGPGLAGGESSADEAPPSEEGVLQLASDWSIDPTTLDEHFKEPVMGRLGTGTWAAAEPTAAPDRPR